VDVLSSVSRYHQLKTLKRNFTIKENKIVDHLSNLFPVWFPQLGIQCTSAILGGITTTTLINPLDIVRARLQVKLFESFQGVN
jgi:hypothetical protein